MKFIDAGQQQVRGRSLVVQVRLVGTSDRGGHELRQRATGQLVEIILIPSLLGDGQGIAAPRLDDQIEDVFVACPFLMLLSPRVQISCVHHRQRLRFD